MYNYMYLASLYN